VHIPEDLHKKFKQQLLKEGVTQREVITILVGFWTQSKKVRADIRRLKEEVCGKTKG